MRRSLGKMSKRGRRSEDRPAPTINQLVKSFSVGDKVVIDLKSDSPACRTRVTAEARNDNRDAGEKTTL